MSLEKERVEALQRVIDELRDEPGALMPIMQRAQDIFGYLPEDVQKYIAKEMDILRAVQPGAEGAVHHQRVHGHGLLRQGQQEGAG